MLITGAASGIGRSVALLAAEREPGVALALVDRDRERLDEVSAQLLSFRARPLVLTADLVDPLAPAAVVAAAVEAFEGLDVLVSNAGATGRGSLLDLTVAEWDRCFDLNTRATWILACAAHDSLVKSSGSIVVTTSISGRHATPRAGAYSVSKAALSMLVRHVALEWGPHGVRVNGVAPGPVATAMTFATFGDVTDPAARERRAKREAVTPLRRVGEADEVAEVVLFLAGPGAVHLTGVEVPVDGGLGLTLMPGSRE